MRVHHGWSIFFDYVRMGAGIGVGLALSLVVATAAGLCARAVAPALRRRWTATFGGVRWGRVAAAVLIGGGLVVLAARVELASNSDTLAAEGILPPSPR